MKNLNVLVYALAIGKLTLALPTHSGADSVVSDTISNSNVF